MRRDNRSPEAAQYHKLYSTYRWQKRRAAQLNAYPLCAMCMRQGKVTPAIVAHHKLPHKGDATLFWTGELESLCAPCHDSEAQSQERTGKARVSIGEDGWPIETPGGVE